MTSSFSSAGNGGFTTTNHQEPTYADCHAYAQLMRDRCNADYGWSFQEAKKMHPEELQRKIRGMKGGNYA